LCGAYPLVEKIGGLLTVQGERRQKKRQRHQRNAEYGVCLEDGDGKRIRFCSTYLDTGGGKQRPKITTLLHGEETQKWENGKCNEE